MTGWRRADLDGPFDPEDDNRDPEPVTYAEAARVGAERARAVLDALRERST